MLCKAMKGMALALYLNKAERAMLQFETQEVVALGLLVFSYTLNAAISSHPSSHLLKLATICLLKLVEAARPGPGLLSQ